MARGAGGRRDEAGRNWIRHAIEDANCGDKGNGGARWEGRTDTAVGKSRSERADRMARLQPD